MAFELRYSPDQPRDDKGRFGVTGDSYNAKDVFGNEHVEVTPELSKAYDDAKSVGTKTISIKDLTPTQKYIGKQDVDHIAENYSPTTKGPAAARYPTVLKHEGKTYVFDGHHRLAAQALLGKTSAKVNVLESKSLRYAPDQPRDDHGRFGEGEGSVALLHEDYAAAHATVLDPTVSEGGTGATSSEELARPSVFIKYSPAGTPTYLGKQPDSTLRPGEAVIGVNKITGKATVQNTNGLTDKQALAKFGTHAVTNYGPNARALRYSPDQPRDSHGRFGDGDPDDDGPTVIRAPLDAGIVTHDDEKGLKMLLTQLETWRQGAGYDETTPAGASAVGESNDIMMTLESAQDQPDLHFEDNVEEYEQILAETGDAPYQLAYTAKDGMVEAVAQFRVNDNGILGVDHFAAAPWAIGTGAGGRVLAKLEKVAKEAGCTKIALDALSGSEKFYEKNGFKPVDGHYEKTIRSIDLRYSADQPRDDHGRFGEGAGLDAGRQADYSDAKLSDALADVMAQCEALEDAGKDEGKEYEALTHMGSSLSTVANMPDSARQYTRSAFVFNGDKIVGAGVMVMNKEKTEATIAHVGSIQPGAGKLVMGKLLEQAREVKSLTAVKLTSSSYANDMKFYEKFGFADSGGSVGSHGEKDMTLNLRSQRSLEYRFEFNAADPQAILCGTVFLQGVQPIPSYASYKAANTEPIETIVSLDQIVPTQDELWSEKLATAAWKDSTLDVIQLGDKLLLWDGHHRTGAAILAGQKTLAARIYVIEVE